MKLSGDGLSACAMLSTVSSGVWCGLRRKERLKQFSSAQCLALAEQSPQAVAEHDKDAWLDLFAWYNLVEDPVGSAPHVGGIYDQRQGYRGRGRLERFYETFIAPNSIRFEVHQDIVCGLHVMRDITIVITMSPDVMVRVPVHLLYELTPEEGRLKIFRLAAHWELWPMLRQQMSTGLPFLKVGWASGARMMRYQGMSGIGGFMRGLSSVGIRGKGQVNRFAQYFNSRDTSAMQGLFSRLAAGVNFPVSSATLSPAECIAQGGTMSFSKVLAAGNVVSVTVDYRKGGTQYPGVALFELNKKSLEIVASSFYW